MTVEEQIRQRGQSPATPYMELTKPGIAVFVMITAGVGYAMAALPSMSWKLLFHVMFGVYVSTSGALALNQFIERGADSLMNRTRTRPLPSGRLQPTRALFFGGALLLAGLGHLWYWTGIVPAGITLVSAVLYNGVYTPLKRINSVATLVGAIPGALPALIGWSAFDGTIDIRGLTLFGILFFWQLVHVLSLGWNLRTDYAKAGIQLIPPGDSSKPIAILMVLYSLALVPVSVAPTLLGMTGLVYAVGAGVLSGGLLLASAGFLLNPSRKRCSRVFFGSLLYHPVLLTLMVASAAFGA